MALITLKLVGETNQPAKKLMLSKRDSMCDIGALMASGNWARLSRFP